MNITTTSALFVYSWENIKPITSFVSLASAINLWAYFLHVSSDNKLLFTSILQSAIVWISVKCLGIFAVRDVSHRNISHWRLFDFPTCSCVQDALWSISCPLLVLLYHFSVLNYYLFVGVKLSKLSVSLKVNRFLRGAFHS